MTIDLQNVTITNESEMVVRKKPKGWLAFYWTPEMQWQLAYPLGHHDEKRDWNVCPAPLHATRDDAIESATFRTYDGGRIRVMEVKLES